MIELNKEKVGILIPTFNRKSFLEKALQSVCQQTYASVEIIVIDNGSADGTAVFMSSISDPRVRYVVNEGNIGMIGSINKGISLFSDEVEWCTILGDDDLLDRDFIKNLLQTAVVSAAKSIVHSHRIFIDKAGNRIREATLSPHEETAFEYMKMRAHFKRETYLTGVLFNRKAFMEINGYPVFLTGLATDDAFIFALSLKDRLVFERNALAYIRIHEGAESASCTDGMKKLQTLKQFEEYCRKVASKSENVTRNQLEEFEGLLRRFLKVANSYWWIRTVHCEVDQENKDYKQLSELLSLVRRNKDTYTFRVRFSITFRTLTGIFLEVYPSYRTCWDNAISVSRLFGKYLGKAIYAGR